MIIDVDFPRLLSQQYSLSWSRTQMS